MSTENQNSTTETPSSQGGVSDRTFDIHSCINEICDVIEAKTITIRKPHKDGSMRYGIKKAIDAMLYGR